MERVKNNRDAHTERAHRRIDWTCRQQKSTVSHLRHSGLWGCRGRHRQRSHSRTLGAPRAWLAYPLRQIVRGEEVWNVRTETVISPVGRFLSFLVCRCSSSGRAGETRRARRNRRWRDEDVGCDVGGEKRKKGFGATLGGCQQVGLESRPAEKERERGRAPTCPTGPSRSSCGASSPAPDRGSLDGLTETQTNRCCHGNR